MNTNGVHSNGSPKAVVCFGDPVMDVIVNVEYDFLHNNKCEPGGCIPVDPFELDRLITAASSTAPTVTRVPGGSASNVAKGLALMASTAVGSNRHAIRFVGMIGQDQLGQEYAARLESAGVQPSLVMTSSDAPTARCLSMVTSDGQRTMRTHLGASIEMREPEALPSGWDNGLALLHCEGYCLYRPDIAKAAMRRAKELGAVVSLDMASFETVKNCLASLTDILKEGLVDIMFSNEQEAERLADVMQPGGPKGGYHGHAEGTYESPWVVASQDHVLKYCKVSVVSMGSRGCVARSRDGERGVSPACRVPVVDTTGAGDYFTAGFLHGYVSGAPLQRCCVLGCASGAEAVQVVGAELPAAAKAALQKQVISVLTA